MRRQAKNLVDMAKKVSEADNMTQQAKWTIYTIIAAAGGSAMIAGRLGRSRSTVNAWRRNGIPAKYWPSLVACVPRLTTDDIMRANEDLIRCGRVWHGEGREAISGTNGRRS